MDNPIERRVYVNNRCFFAGENSDEAGERYDMLKSEQEAIFFGSLDKLRDYKRTLNEITRGTKYAGCFDPMSFYHELRGAKKVDEWANRLGVKKGVLSGIKRDIENILGPVYFANDAEIDFYFTLDLCPYSKSN